LLKCWAIVVLKERIEEEREQEKDYLKKVAMLGHCPVEYQL
jgi:hypothetical protein